MRKKEILIGIAGKNDDAKEFVRAWKRAEQGLPPQKPIDRLYFEDIATLFKYLSPRRFEMLQYLRLKGPKSIRKLAVNLNRDYKNVHTDVKELIHLGLIQETKDKQLTVPWDVITAQLPLLAKAN